MDWTVVTIVIMQQLKFPIPCIYGSEILIKIPSYVRSSVGSPPCIGSIPNLMLSWRINCTHQYSGYCAQYPSLGEKDYRIR
jgi:hypothetical protein